MQRPGAIHAHHDSEETMDPSLIPPKEISDLFTIDWERKLGEGAFSIVRTATHKTTKRVYALKMVDLRPLRLRRSFNLDRLLREVRIQQALEHPSIVKLRGCYATKAYLWMIQDLVTGGELFDQIIKHGAFSEICALTVIQQLISAVAYIHSTGAVHRDIKPENILLSYPDEVGKPSASPCTEGAMPSIHLVDFGLAKRLGAEHSVAKTVLGTPLYMAPEVLTASQSGLSYDAKVDSWSVGVVMYLLLYGCFPFEDPGEADGDMGANSMSTTLASLTGSFSFPTTPAVTNAAKHLICGLLSVDPKVRLSMEDALKHPWFTGIDQHLLPRVADSPTHNREAARRYSLPTSPTSGMPLDHSFASSAGSSAGSEPSVPSDAASGAGAGAGSGHMSPDSAATPTDTSLRATLRVQGESCYIADISDDLCRLLSYSPEEVIGQGMAFIAVPETTALGELIRVTGAAVDADFTLKARDRDIPVKVTIRTYSPTPTTEVCADVWFYLPMATPRSASTGPLTLRTNASLKIVSSSESFVDWLGVEDEDDVIGHQLTEFLVERCGMFVQETLIPAVSVTGASHSQSMRWLLPATPETKVPFEVLASVDVRKRPRGYEFSVSPLSVGAAPGATSQPHDAASMPPPPVPSPAAPAPPAAAAAPPPPAAAAAAAAARGISIMSDDAH